MFGWPTTRPSVSTQQPHNARTCRVWKFNSLIFMQREPPFVCLHLPILLIGNRPVLWKVLWFKSLGTGVLHFASFHLPLRAPLLRLFWFTSCSGLSNFVPQGSLGGQKKACFVPFSWKFLLGKQVSSRLECLRGEWPGFLRDVAPPPLLLLSCGLDMFLLGRYLTLNFFPGFYNVLLFAIPCM